MGAVHKFDLTSDVTHLIVGDVDTPKYKYVAKERPDVKVVLPSFIDAVKQVWMEGGDVDLPALEIEHRAPTFMGLKICLTGFEDPKVRENIKSLALSNGAEFHGDLTKAVTHLICAAPEGKKYEHALRWQIKVVGFEWLQHSLERTMVLEESLYDPILAPLDRGKNAYNKSAMEAYHESLQLGKRKRDEDKAPGPAARRKLRRTLSKKIESQRETIWADIASAGSGQTLQDEWQPSGVDGVGPGGAKTYESEEPTPELKAEPPKRNSSVIFPEPQPSRSNSTFENAVTYVHGFPNDKLNLLQAVLEGNGARVYTSPNLVDAEVESSEVGYAVIPHDVPEDRLPKIPGRASGFLRVTEWWVENCLQNKTLVDPATYPLCRPFEKHSVEGFRGLVISSTGFSSKGMDLLHIQRVVNLMGATYSERLDAKVNVLVCNTQAPINQEKLDFASENNIEAVSEQWLYHSISKYSRQDTRDYCIKMETPTVPVDYVPTIKAKTSMSRLSLKGRALPLGFTASNPERTKDSTTPAAKPRANAKASRGPFYEDEDDEQYSGLPAEPETRKTQGPGKHSSSQPLTALSQERQNSQNNRARPSDCDQSHERGEHESSLSLPQNENLATTVTDTSQKNEQLNNAIASLLAARQNSNLRRSTSDKPIPKEISTLGKRRRGPLGRASSGGSLVSLRADSIGSNVSQEESGQKDSVPDPSQKIIYEDERAVEERRALIRKMGGQVDGEGVDVARVESIGIVKDAIPSNVAGGLASLASGRAKRKTAARG
ncbi:hypothetical protein, variant 1 [Verruconis gallopava]|nr:hypothetical protein, variant 1 [Verruconis gallopava]KIW00044.1 hypothetical protein, variant 1 [Verruconis gallopava]